MTGFESARGPLTAKLVCASVETLQNRRDTALNSIYDVYEPVFVNSRIYHGE